MAPRKGFSAKRGRAGFTLTELLVVVAIVIVLLAVGIISLITIQKNLRQRELDTKAETIYVAVQRRMVELRAMGYENLYQYSLAETNGVKKVGLIPCDAAGDTEITDDTLCYTEYTPSSAKISASAEDLMPEGSIDEELRANQWHIEFDPESGSVYGVYYSETEAIPEDSTELDNLRIKKQRLKAGATVGYYGGDLSQTETTDTLLPGISIENKEELKVTFYCNNPSPGEKLTFDITLSDGKNTYKKTITHENLVQVTSRTYRYVWTLDSLKSEKSRFYEQTEHKLDCGTDLDITLTVSSTDTLVDTATTEGKTNSLFAYRKDSSSADTALISYGRHLQNLDDASHVTDKITKATQISDISFADDANDDADWYSKYGDTFKPIENDNLTLYNGRSTIEGNDVATSIYSLHIPNTSGGEAGLFKTYSGEIKNVTLTGTRIDKGSFVGALIGTADGNVSIENCEVYLSAKQGDLDGITAAEEVSDVKDWISGSTVGGLIGRSTSSVAMTNSFASTVLNGQTKAGGLIGQVEGTVTAESVYADSYIKAPVTGGLFGGTSANAAINLNNFYAVGYQAAKTIAAGIVPGAVASAQNGYTACSFGSTSGVTTYSTAQAGSMSNVYYLLGANAISGTQKLTYEELSSDEGVAKLGDAFTSNSGGSTYPYNLMGQGLSTYSYPRLTALDHYGDWQAEFESGKLVYYEVYEDGTYAFEGANVSTLVNNKVVVGDGYALAYTAETKPVSTESITVTTAQGESSFNAGDAKEVKSGNDTYYLVPLPKAVTNPDLGTNTESFYQKITIKSNAEETEYYYNPYFAKTVTTHDSTPAAPSAISVRTARQLNAMSKYYAKYAGETANSNFNQELNIDYTKYNWSEYSNSTSVTEQAPIDAANGFVANYNGGYHTITGISITSTVADTGFFGTVGKGGVVRNVFLTGRNGTEKITRSAGTGAAVSGSKNSSQIGALVGVNNGTITNCAVSGYSMTYYGYNSNVVDIGGLVGVNNGTVRQCSADAASIVLTSNSAYSYAGGLAGKNTGSINSCYATGQINVLDARSSTVWIAGFVGDNSNGTTRRCYAATALTASGTAESYGFARIGGAVADCRYLDGGTYSYAGTLYAYNTSTNEFAEEGLAAGVKITGAELENLHLSGFSTAAASYNHAETGTASDNYTYPAVVTNGNGKVHYGNWPVQQYIGTVGMFYWEYEAYGSNSGYHFSYVGYADGNGISGDSLCYEHDDGGVVTKYGYGYFYAADESKPSVSLTAVNLGTENTEAGSALHDQMPKYNFVAYETGEGNSKLHTTTFTKNSTWTLTSSSSDKYTFIVSPFFANAMSLESVQFSRQSAQNLNNAEPGAEGNTYEIRSEAQLQFINWNSEKQTATYSITDSTFEKETSDSKRGNRKYVRDYYPYLLCGNPNSIPTKDTQLYWEQSHDIDAYEENGYKNVDFTPIGSMYDTGYNDANAQPYVAFFPYSFNGQAYKIKNIEIHSTNQAIGLFGMTAGAQLQNIIMYSDRGNEIVNEANGTGWYTMGGIAGFAGSRKSSVTATTDSFFKNCTVSGYKIIDKRATTPGWGGGNVGGLAGMTNMDITNCSAVNDIELRISYNEGWKNLRVGGITGVCRSTINSCYAGGSIRSYDTQYDSGNTSNSCIWVGGISGGIVVRNTGKLADLLGYVDRSLIVSNCYSYVDLPDAPKSLGQSGYNHVRAAMSIACNGEMLAPNSWFTKGDVPARTVRIYNCYALEDNVKNTTDYKNYGTRTSFNGININALDTNGDKVYVYNGSNDMYLTYDEMQSSMSANLNKSVTATYDYVNNWGTETSNTITVTGNFGTVTTTEHGVSINGKYSFPGNDVELKGMNYPFPTVLTQTDVFGNTVNTHYGAWPKYGIYWEQSSETFDLFANRQTDAQTGETVSLMSMKLRVYGSPSQTLSKDDITFCDDEGTELPASTCPMEVYSVSSAQTDSTGTYYTVTFKGLKEGTAFVHAKLGTKTTQTTVTVKSKLTVKLSENKLELEPGEEKTISMTFYAEDKDGKEYQIKPETARLSWDVVIKSGEDAVICDNDTVKYDSSTGTLKLTATGRLLEDISDEEGHIQITCTYQFGTDENEKMSESEDILFETKSPDFVNLMMGEENHGWSFLNDTAKSQRSIGALADQVTERGDGIALREKYVELNDVDMSMFTITVGQDVYTPDANGQILRNGECIATITIGESVYDSECDYTFWPVSVENKLDESITLKATVRTGTILQVEIPAASQEESESQDGDYEAQDFKTEEYDEDTLNGNAGPS